MYMLASVASIAKFAMKMVMHPFSCTKMATFRTIFAVVKQQQQGGRTHSSAKVPDGRACEYGM